MVETFGVTSEDDDAGDNIENYIAALIASPDSDGSATSITARLAIETAAHKCKCALYNYTTGDFVAETEEKDLAVEGKHWETFDFAAPVNVYSSITYAICAWGEAEAGSIYFYYNGVASELVVAEDETYNGFPESIEQPWDDSAENYVYLIYCTYTSGPPVVPSKEIYMNTSKYGNELYLDRDCWEV